MLNFTVGPVMMEDAVKAIGGCEVPYFRTPEFSAIMKENERLFLNMMKAPEGSRCVFLTGSGTAAMEAAVINSFDKRDKLIVVNGGSFGHRFVQLCQLHRIPFSEIRLEYGQALGEAQLALYENAGYTGLLVNLTETSTGVLYDMDMIGSFCRRNGIFLVSDCVSAFLADPFDMDKTGVNIAFTGSQKALAVPPGISVVALDKIAVERVMCHNSGSMYLDIPSHLNNMERGQTPFTPAVGTLLQIHERLRLLDARGGVDAENARTKQQAEDFRRKIAPFGFGMLSQSPSNAVTALTTGDGVSAYHIFEVLKDEYGIFICPNGGELAEKVFRVGHIGHLTPEDNDTLIEAFEDLKKRGII